MGGRYVPSLLAAIGDVIERHMIDSGFLVTDSDSHEAAAGVGDRALRFCPKCDQPALIFAEGCHSCLSCGYSKCA
jgi:ribonucleoside-diphosphate reductase alpha chain